MSRLFNSEARHPDWYAFGCIGTAGGLFISFVAGVLTIDKGSLAVTLCSTLIPPIAGCLIGVGIGKVIDKCSNENEGETEQLIV